MVPPAHRVLVAGGGFAAAEAVLALRALAPADVQVTLLSADRHLPLRPLATVVPFAAATVPRVDLAELAGESGARFREDVLQAVAPSARRVRLASGTVLGYDAVLLALGARARIGVPGAVTFRDQRDVRRVGAVVERPAVRELVLASPAGRSWTLPLYELALRSAPVLAGRRGRVTVVTPEPAPLVVFGARASAAVAALLEAQGVRLLTGARPRTVDRGGLRLASGAAVAADEVVALPVLGGPRLVGLPADTAGFVPTDLHGRVPGAEGVWAAGDMTAWPVKQGGLAAQQAEAAARDIAARAGAAPAPGPAPLVLRARLEGGPQPLFLRAEIGPGGRTRGEATVGAEPPWWPAAKVFAGHLSPWMAAHAHGEALAATAR